MLGACLLNPRRDGFEPLKPVEEPDAANSRIRFDVRLGGSFAAIVRCTVSEVAKLSRLRVQPGTVRPGRASGYCGRGGRGPTRWRPSRRRAEKLTEAARLLDLSEHRLGQLLLKRYGLECPPALILSRMAATRAPPPSPSRRAWPARRDIGVDLAFLHRCKVGVGAIARVRRQLHRLLAQIGFDGVGHRPIDVDRSASRRGRRRRSPAPSRRPPPAHCSPG